MSNSSVGSATKGLTTIACRRCQEPFSPRRTGGRAQQYCSLRCRRDLDAAARDAGRLFVEAEYSAENNGQPTRALLREGKDANYVSDSPLDAGADPRPLVRFVVELQASTLDLLIAGRWLKPNAPLTCCRERRRRNCG